MGDFSSLLNGALAGGTNSPYAVGGGPITQLLDPTKVNNNAKPGDANTFGKGSINLVDVRTPIMQLLELASLPMLGGMLTNPTGTFGEMFGSTPTPGAASFGKNNPAMSMLMNQYSNPWGYFMGTDPQQAQTGAVNSPFQGILQQVLAGGFPGGTPTGPTNPTDPNNPGGPPGGGTGGNDEGGGGGGGDGGGDGGGENNGGAGIGDLTIPDQPEADFMSMLMAALNPQTQFLATGGTLDPNAINIVGEQGPEMITGNQVTPLSPYGVDINNPASFSSTQNPMTPDEIRVLRYLQRGNPQDLLTNYQNWGAPQLDLQGNPIGGLAQPGQIPEYDANNTANAQRELYGNIAGLQGLTGRGFTGLEDLIGQLSGMVGVDPTQTTAIQQGANWNPAWMNQGQTQQTQLNEVPTNPIPVPTPAIAPAAAPPTGVAPQEPTGTPLVPPTTAGNTNLGGTTGITPTPTAGTGTQGAGTPGTTATTGVPNIQQQFNGQLGGLADIFSGLLSQNPEGQTFDLANNLLGQNFFDQNPGQGVIDALEPVFQRNLSFGLGDLANRAPSVSNSAMQLEGTDLTRQALQDFNVLGAQALQQGLSQQLSGLGTLGTLAGQAGQNPMTRALGVGNLALTGRGQDYQNQQALTNLAQQQQQFNSMFGLQQNQQNWNQNAGAALQLLMSILPMLGPTGYQTVAQGG